MLKIRQETRQTVTRTLQDTESVLYYYPGQSFQVPLGTVTSCIKANPVTTISCEINFLQTPLAGNKRPSSYPL